MGSQVDLRCDLGDIGNSSKGWFNGSGSDHELKA